jgi:hypothetical protein
MTDIVAAAANDPGPKRRTWVQIVEAPDGGWGIDGRAYANSEIAEEAKRQLAAQQEIGWPPYRDMDGQYRRVYGEVSENA